jgi:GTPase Era involved in 16S rRNA processing
MKSHTSDIRAVRVVHPSGSGAVVFVDTPGFDDTYKSDTEILCIIADWLVKM